MHTGELDVIQKSLVLFSVTQELFNCVHVGGFLISVFGAFAMFHHLTTARQLNTAHASAV